MKHNLLILLLVGFIATGCGWFSVERKFEKRYAAWHNNLKHLPYTEKTADLISMPTFRAIVALGRPALPHIIAKMQRERGVNDFLAFAVVEISGWNPADFSSDPTLTGNVGEFRDNVMAKYRELNPEPPPPWVKQP